MNTNSPITLSLEQDIAYINLTGVIDKQFIIAFEDAINQVEDHKEIITVVIKGEDFFSNDIDIESFLPIEKPPHITAFQRWEKLCKRVEKLEKHTIIILRGDCRGFGLSLLMVCDTRLVHSDTVFTIPEIGAGFLPSIAVLNLPKYIGLGRAKDLLIGGESFTATQALQWGIVSKLVADGNSKEQVASYIEEERKYPIALQLARRLMTESFATSAEDFLGHYLAAQHRAINSN